MKNTATYLLAVFFLMAGCSRGATYFTTKPTDSYKAYQKPQETEKLTLTATPAAIAAVGSNIPIDISLATASSSASFVPVAASVPGPAYNIAPPSLPASASFAITEEAPGDQTSGHVIYQKPPPGKKKAMVGLAEAGFALSLFGLVSIALLFISPYFLYFSGLLALTGLILSFAGLLKVRSSNGKYRGKVRSLVGLVLGAIGTALVIYLIGEKF